MVTFFTTSHVPVCRVVLKFVNTYSHVANKHSLFNLILDLAAPDIQLVLVLYFKTVLHSFVAFLEQEHNEVHIIPETKSSQNDEGEDVQVSTQKTYFFVLWTGCSTRKRHSKIILSPKILNLPSYSLSKNQKKILIKGLKYTPTPKGNIIELKRNVLEFTRKLRLIEMFSSEEKKIKNEVDISLVKAKSSLFTHLEAEKRVWTKKLIFYNNKLFKLLAIINQILPKLSGKIY